MASLGSTTLSPTGRCGPGYTWFITTGWPTSPGRADPHRGIPLAGYPQSRPRSRCRRDPALRQDGPKGWRLPAEQSGLSPDTEGVVPGLASGRGMSLPLSFHSTGFKGFRQPDSPEAEKEYLVEWRLLRSSMFQLDGMEVMVSLIISGACEQYPDFRFVLGESGVTGYPICWTASTWSMRTGPATLVSP